MPSPGGLTRGAGIAIVAVVILGAASGASPGLVGAQATDGPTAILSCTTITEPGAYELTQDIAADSSGEACIVIDLEGTVVLDGQGHSIGGGIDAEAAGEDAAVTLDLRDTTVDFIRYPGGFDGPGASGVLEKVRVGTLDLWSASGLTIQSSHVESGIPNGFFAYDVTIRHSTFEGPVRFDENAGEFEVVNNTFAEEVAFWEELTDSRIADNTFRSSLVLTDAGGGPDHVVIEANHFTVAGDRRSAIEFEGGADSVIRNNVIAVEHDAPETDGIFLAHGRQNVIEGNVVQGANNGVFLIDESDSRIVDNTLTDNRIGVKVNSREQVTFERNVLSNNAAFGVQNTDRGAFVFDARNNYWGATDGPSSAPANDPDAPFADPETCALANGSGDAVSEGDRDGVSNVRFDPFLTAPPDETDDGATPTPSPTVTPTRTPEATPSPTETPTPEDTPTSTPEDTPTSTETPMSTPEDPPMSTPEDTPTATPEDTPTATPGDTPTPTPTPEDTPTETDDGETSDEPTEGGDDRPTDASTEDSAEAGGTDTEVVIVAGTRSPAETDGQPGFGAIVALVAITLAALIGRRWRA